jgi:hypothetical protein
MKPVLHPAIRTFALLTLTVPAVFAQSPGQAMDWMPDLTQQQDYTLLRATSKEPTGANADARTINPGVTLTILDTDGPGMISHMWFTINSGEPYHLKRIVMRLYWDNETTPSVEAPIGDFFGLGTGDYVSWQSEMLSVGNSKALNSFFPMPYRKHARITITNEGKNAVGSFYYNVEYRTYKHALAAKTLYFHAQYRQAQPNHGWTNQWFTNYDPLVAYTRNVDGKDNYVWFEAKGEGHYVGVTMSVLQNQDGWWGEGNDMFFIDGASEAAIAGTGTEDYFLGAWDFGAPFSCMARPSSAKNSPVSDRAFTASISTHRFPLQRA